MTRAIASGGPEHLGWGVDRHLAADTYDAINLNTRATGQWKNKAPTFPTWPRPKPATPKGEKRRTTVADIYRRFTERQARGG